MEPLHIGVARRQRQRQPCGDVLRKPRVVAGRERELPLQTDPPRGQANRPFGSDMDSFRLKLLEALLHLLERPHGEFDLGIGRQREGRELIGTDHFDQVAHVAQFPGHARKRAHDAVDLGLPGVRGQHYAHQAIAGSVYCDGVGATRRPPSIMDHERRFAQGRISRRPSKCSTTAVQLSTQSPSFM